MHKTRTQRAAELRQGIEEYFDARREENRFPTEAGMLLSLGLSEGAWTGSRTRWSPSPGAPPAA